MKNNNQENKKGFWERFKEDQLTFIEKIGIGLLTPSLIIIFTFIIIIFPILMNYDNYLGLIKGLIGIILFIVLFVIVDNLYN